MPGGGKSLPPLGSTRRGAPLGQSATQERDFQKLLRALRNGGDPSLPTFCDADRQKLLLRVLLGEVTFRSTREHREGIRLLLGAGAPLVLDIFLLYHQGPRPEHGRILRDMLASHTGSARVRILHRYLGRGLLTGPLEALGSVPGTEGRTHLAVHARFCGSEDEYVALWEEIESLHPSEREILNVLLSETAPETHAQELVMAAREI